MIGNKVLISSSGARRRMQQAPVDLTQGLAAHFLLNNNADDISVNDFNLTASAGIDFQGDQAKFNGSSGYAELNSIAISPVYYFSFWLETDVDLTSSSTSECIVSFNDFVAGEAGGVYRNMFIGGISSLVTGEVLTIITGNDPYGITYITDTISAGRHFIEVSWNTDTLTYDIYVDEVLQTMAHYGGGADLFSTYTDKILIGARRVSGVLSTYLSKALSNFRIYDEAKGTAFREALFAEGYYPKLLPLPTDEGLRAYFPLTGTAEDAQGEGGNESGTEYNGVTFPKEYFVAGTKAPKFNGIDGFMTNSSFSWTTSKSFSFWASGDIAISNEVTGAESNRVSVYTYNGTVESRSRDLTGASGDYKYRKITNAVPIDDKYHFVFIYVDTMTYELYINGTYISDINFTKTIEFGTLDTPAIGLAIGRYDYNGAISYREGSISDLKIYDRVITQTDVNNIIAGNAPTDTLVECPLDVDFIDDKGNHTFTPSNVSIAEHRNDSVAYFDGVDDYLYVGETVSTLETITYSFAGFIQISDYGTYAIMNNNAVAVASGSADNSGSWLYVDAAGKVNFRYHVLNDETYTPSNGVETTNFTITITTTNSINVNEWLHVGVVLENGNSAKLYINGLLEASVQTTQVMPYGTVNDNYSIGAVAHTTTNIYYMYKGYMADLRHFDVALTANEMLSLANQTEDITRGLVYYKPLTFYSRAEDMWVSYDGVENGGFTYTDDAQFGSCAVFDGVDNNISFPLSMLSTKSIGAVSLLIKGSGVFFGLYKSGVTTNLLYLYLGTTIRIRMLDTTNSVDNQIDTTRSNLVSTEWYHIVIMSDGNQYKIYIDGVDEPLTVTTGLNNGKWFSSIVAPTDLRLGRVDIGTIYNFTGNAINLRIHDKPLSLQEIVDIKNYDKNFRPIDIDDGLVAYYPLANNSLDNYKNQYDGTDSNMSYDGLSGDFNGTSSYITTGMTDTNFMSTGEFGIAMWFNVDSFTNANYFVRTYRGTDPYQFISFGFGLGDNTFQYVQRDSSDTTFLALSNPTISLINTWYHATISVSSTTIVMYINGVEVASIANTENGLTASTLSILLGRNTFNNTYMDGSLAKARFYNKAPTAEQVAVIYNTEKGDFGL